MIKGKNLIDPKNFSLEEYDEIFELVKNIIQSPEKYRDVAKGKILCSLFFEPSTRTRLSFESAMLRLGGKVVGFSDGGSSSTSKGESLGDTMKVVASYGDIIATRHPKEGAAYLGSRFSKIPLINAGDGGHQHPTQTLTDLVTIKTELGKLEGLKVGVCGDLKFGRTVHSLVNTLDRYENNEFVFISPDELKMPAYVTDELKSKYTELGSLEEAIGDVDILYMTRVQKERFDTEEEYLRLKDSYILTEDIMRFAKEDMIVMHPLPRVNEITYEVDEDKRAVYFKQAEYGVYARMALIALILGVVDESNTRGAMGEDYIIDASLRCINPNCITNCESQPYRRFYKRENDLEYRCKYCDKSIKE